MKRKWTKFMAGIMAACLCMASAPITALADSELLINTETLRRIKEDPNYRLYVMPGEMFIGLGAEGCTIGEVEESFKKYQPESIEMFDKNCGGSVIGNLNICVYYYNYWEDTNTEEEWIQRCREVRIYPDGSPWNIESDVSYLNDMEFYTGNLSDADIKARIDSDIAWIESVNSTFNTSNKTVTAGNTTSEARWIQDANGWWFDAGDGTWPANTWKWIDGNKDGTAECYYFNADGYLLSGTTTPDGYQVNQDGAWVLNGVIQTQ